MANKWEIGPVKLANGSEAEITRINEGQEDFCYVGHVMIGATWHPAGWHADGRMMYHGDSGNSLAPPPKKTVRVQACILVYEDGSAISTSSDESDLGEAKKHAFALVKFDREVTEGEGL